jgi:hypothetical protein
VGELHVLHPGASEKKGNVVVFAPKKVDITPNEKFHSLTIINKFMPHISPAEFSVVYFVWLRTIYWGKPKEYVCFRHFLEGIPDTVEPLNISRSTLIRSLKNLVSGGMLFRAYHRDGGSSFTINFSWGPEMLKQPKNPKQKTTGGLKSSKKIAEKSTEKGGVKMTLGGCQNDTHKYENNKSVHTGVSGKPQTPDTEVLSATENLTKSTKEAQERSRAQRAKNLARAAERESVADLERLWQEAMRIAHPEYPIISWTKKQYGQARNLRDAFRAKNPDAKFAPFLKFCIDDWDRVIAFRFSWKDDLVCPEFPDIDFIFGFKKEFLFTYADKEFHTRSLGLSEYEREMRKYKKMGYTEEQAEKAIKHSAENSKAVQKQRERAEQLESGVRGLSKKVKQLEHEKAMLEIQRGRELMKQRKQKKSDPEPVKRNIPVDADGWAEFKGFEDFGGFDD